MCIRQGMFFVDVQALVMNGKPLDRKAFEQGQQIARDKRAMNSESLRSTQHHTKPGNTTLRTTAVEAVKGRS